MTIEEFASYEKRYGRNKEKTLILLNFLKEETYSDKATLMRLLNIPAKGNFYIFLKKLTQDGLIEKYAFCSTIANCTIWGITLDGLSVVLPKDAPFPAHFEPSKITGWSLQHHLLNQQVRIILEGKGAKDWLHGDRRNFASKFTVKHRPDGVFTLPDGARVAVETERTLKTKSRYKEIMKSHIVARTNEDWFYVFYIFPDEQKKAAVKKMFSEIKVLTFPGSVLTLEPKHRRIFKFFTLKELEVIEL